MNLTLNKMETFKICAVASCTWVLILHHWGVWKLRLSAHFLYRSCYKILHPSPMHDNVWDMLLSKNILDWAAWKLTELKLLPSHASRYPQCSLVWVPLCYNRQCHYLSSSSKDSWKMLAHLDYEDWHAVHQLSLMPAGWRKKFLGRDRIWLADPP